MRGPPFCLKVLVDSGGMVIGNERFCSTAIHQHVPLLTMTLASEVLAGIKSNEKWLRGSRRKKRHGFSR